MIHAEACASQVYQPMVHLVLQGAKTLSIGDQVLRYLPITYFLVPVDVPATGEIHPSGPGLPYLAISLTLDPNVIATLLTGETMTAEQPTTSRFSAVTAHAEMIDAWLRMLRLMDRPNEAAVLAPMIEREILFRVLQGPLGPMLREIARPDGRLAQIRRATQWIREHYTEPFRVEPLATMTDMSVESASQFSREYARLFGMPPARAAARFRAPIASGAASP